MNPISKYMRSPYTEKIHRQQFWASLNWWQYIPGLIIIGITLAAIILFLTSWALTLTNTLTN